MGKATVYFTNELTPEAVVKMYRQLGIDLPGKVAVKVHSGEDGNQNYLRLGGNLLPDDLMHYR